MYLDHKIESFHQVLTSTEPEVLACTNQTYLHYTPFDPRDSREHKTVSPKINVSIANNTPTCSKRCDTSPDNNNDNQSMPAEEPAQILIAGGGIVGLLLALALKKNLPSVAIDVYEQTHGFDPDVGAGMGLYANGLRVVRDIDPDLLKEIQDAGYPYLYRRWERHDGTAVAEADEGVLGSGAATADEEEKNDGDGLQTMGIRRWKLQQVLHTAVAKAGIPIHFSKKVEGVETPQDGMTEVVFADGSRRKTQLLVGADGGRSAVRSILLEQMYPKSDPDAATASNVRSSSKNKKPTLSYTGVTCIMGAAPRNSHRGISFPVSNTTRCHGAFYPTGANEECFQFHFPVGAQQDISCSDADDSCWGNLSQQMSRQECGRLAEILEKDGWDEDKYLAPLRQVTRAVRVGFCKLSPALKAWSFPNAKGQPRTILVGDAAHPPVPYIGQGAQQGMEDVGTLALLLKTFCLDDQGQFDLSNLHRAVHVYEKIRMPRVASILSNAHEMGRFQQKRAENPAYNIIKEEMIQRDVFFHETMPVMFEGARHDYRNDLKRELEHIAKERGGLPLRTIAET
ncbi:Salicylate hydroxylase [Seminavis robusta]|uniref:Salicylate hydroxylase n=1 Tax=Seminavis robusta TaxID=568900 RepID=A0A9N8DJU0_9STRA|nr:Salicylate hydroxylase [Seminavis robusta]|eukprot:Sro161_g072450.1 Salicylate hydroxylase (568) ;mRNA; r:38582-40873